MLIEAVMVGLDWYHQYPAHKFNTLAVVVLQHLVLLTLLDLGVVAVAAMAGFLVLALLLD
jgi:hypothetical protein